MNRVLVDNGIKWIGSLPNTWSITTVNKIFYRRKEVNDVENPTVLSLARDGVKIRDISTNEGQLAESYDNYHKVYKDDLMINPMDLISGANCSLSEVEGVISPAYINLAKKEKIFPKYYDYFFKYQYWIKAMFIHGKGVSFDNRWTLNWETMASYKLPLPSYEEQKRIANCLDNKCFKINQIINDNNYEIDLLEEYKISMIEGAVKNYNKSSSIRNIDWINTCDKSIELVKLKYNSNVSTGTTPKEFDKNESIKKINWFTPSDFKSIELNDSARKLDFDLVPENKLFPKHSTLIIGIGGTLGKVGITRDKSYSNQQITALIGNNKLLPKYLTYNLISAQKYIKDTCPYTTLPILSNSYLKNIFICMRPKEEQEKIVEFLDKQLMKIDQVIKYKKQIIEKLEEYKKSLVYEYVTGKREV